MTTKYDLVVAAYENLGLAEYVFDLQPEEIASGVKRLDRMMADFDARGIRLGYPIAAIAAAPSPTQVISIPDWAEDPVSLQLSLRIAPTIPKQVSMDVKKSAREGYRTLLMADYEIPQMQMPRHMPIGLGNRRNTKNQQFFAPVDRVTTVNDALLEPSGDPWPDSN